MFIPELLCPAGSFESFKAAVNNGADAVYFGGRDFNARAGAVNFTDDELIEAVDYAHIRGAKANITINTLYKLDSPAPDESEIYRALAFAEKMYKAGADALIVTDIGLFSLIRQYMHCIKLHASTQMTVHSLEGAVLLKNLGFGRVVLSRELNLTEIKPIAEKSGVEIEVFAHGALCVSYSGQCLMSSFIGARSGNRGKCAQPCRQYYKLSGNNKKRAEGYLLSPRDMMTLESLKEIAASGVHSLKIEGRMKSPEYVAVVTRAYREQLDRIASGIDVVPENTVKDVTQIFNRGGKFGEGYFFDYAGPHMMSTKTPKSTGTYLGTVVSVSKNEYKNGKKKILIKIEDEVAAGDGAEIWTSTEHTGGYISEEAQAGAIITLYVSGAVKAGDAVYKSYDKQLNDRAKALALADVRKIGLTLKLKAKLGQAVEITLGKDSVEVSVLGSIVEASKNQPLTPERILEQLCKMGGTPFEIIRNSVDMDVDQNIYIPVSELNNLRRNCTEKFWGKYTSSFHRELNEFVREPGQALSPKAVGRQSYGFCVQTVSEEQLEAACSLGVAKAYFTIKGYNTKDILGIISKYADKTALYIALPKIMRFYDEPACKDLIKALDKTEIKGYLASTYGQLSLLKELSKKEIITDYSFNVFSPVAYEYLKGLGVCEITVSTELNINELAAFSCGEVIVYGNLPLMATVQCPVGLYAGKAKNGKREKFCQFKNNSASYALTDKTGAAFPIYTDCESCIALVLNGSKLNMQEKLNNFH